MATEQFANTAATTLNNSGTLTAGATSCTVTSAAAFPASGNFRILIDSEIIIVTAVSGAVFTLTRGQEGTSAASHADGAAVTHVLTKGSLQAILTTRPRFSNTSHALYTIDSTGNNPDGVIWHNQANGGTYVLPAPTDGRSIEMRDQTGAINTLNNNVYVVPHAGEKINGSTGFALTGTAYHFTNGSATVTCTGGHFAEELLAGMSIASSNQAGVNYIVSSVASDTSLTLTTTFTGSTTTTATATRTSLTWAANGGVLYIDSDGTDWLITGDGTPTRLSWTASSGAGTNTAPFIPPAGVYLCEVIGCGGGGGGGGSANASSTTGGNGGNGGGGAQEGRVNFTVTPNTQYNVTIGGGGSAGGVSTAGGLGGITNLAGVLFFAGASGGNGAGSSVFGGAPVASMTAASSTPKNTAFTNTSATAYAPPGTGGIAGAGGAAGTGIAGTSGSPSTAYTGGAGGNPGTFHTTAGSGGGGGGGGASMRSTGGTGGTGGDGESSIGGTGGNGNAQSSPSANTGAGGGGAGGGGAGTGTEGTGVAGAAGASGYLDIIYIL